MSPTFAVEMSFNINSNRSFPNYTHPDNDTRQTTEFKPLTVFGTDCRKFLADFPAVFWVDPVTTVVKFYPTAITSSLLHIYELKRSIIICNLVYFGCRRVPLRTCILCTMLWRETQLWTSGFLIEAGEWNASLLLLRLVLSRALIFYVVIGVRSRGWYLR